MGRLGLFAGLMIALGSFPGVAATFGPGEAAAHTGEASTVCGIVESARYAARSKGQPTFLNIGKPYPHQELTALIWGSERPKFGEPEKTLHGKRICVTGTIQLYRGAAEVILNEPHQLKQ
jgi:hypothetical protein